MIDGPALITRCQRLDMQGRFRESVQLLSDAISANPNESELYYQRGIRNEQMGEYGLAHDDFSSALEIAPLVMEYSVSRGRLLCDRLGRPIDAVLDFQNAMTANQDSQIPHQHMCLCYLLLGDIEKATEHAELALRLKSDDALSHFCLGRCMLDTRDWNSAVDQLTIATQRDSKSDLYWSTLARAHLGANDAEKARECYLKAIEIKPNSGHFLQLGKSQLDAGDLEGASRSFNCANGFDLNEVQRTLVGGYLEIIRQKRGEEK